MPCRLSCRKDHDREGTRSISSGMDQYGMSHREACDSSITLTLSSPDDTSESEKPVVVPWLRSRYQACWSKPVAVTAKGNLAISRSISSASAIWHILLPWQDDYGYIDAVDLVRRNGLWERGTDEGQTYVYAYIPLFWFGSLSMEEAITWYMVKK